MTSTRQHGGTKRSSWLTFHRRLFVASRLLRGAATAERLIAEARAHFDDPEIYPPADRTAVRHDIQALRDEFACRIVLDDQGFYVLVDVGRLVLFDVPDADIGTIAFLLANFQRRDLPNAPAVLQFLERMIAVLPAERRTHLQRPLRDVLLDVPHGSAAEHGHTMQVLKHALKRQHVRFLYRSSFVEHGNGVEHHVAPYDLFFRDGHIYLEAYCLDCGIAAYAERYVNYRIDRVVTGSVRMLPTHVPPIPPSRQRFHVRYRLDVAVARQQDVALWFDNTVVRFADDGSADVSATCTDLWQARQVLLRYREHCQVLEPPQLVAMFRTTVDRMYKQYHGGTP